MTSDTVYDTDIGQLGTPGIPDMSSTDQWTRANIINHLYTRNYEICGTIAFPSRTISSSRIETGNEKIYDRTDQGGTSGRLNCNWNPSVTSQALWHTHPKGHRFYPSVEDILKVIGTRCTYSEIYTPVGLWVLYSTASLPDRATRSGGANDSFVMTYNNRYNDLVNRYKQVTNISRNETRARYILPMPVPSDIHNTIRSIPMITSAESTLTFILRSLNHSRANFFSEDGREPGTNIQKYIRLVCVAVNKFLTIYTVNKQFKLDWYPYNTGFVRGNSGNDVFREKIPSSEYIFNDIKKNESVCGRILTTAAAAVTERNTTATSARRRDATVSNLFNDAEAEDDAADEIAELRAMLAAGEITQADFDEAVGGMGGGEDDDMDIF